MSWGTFITIGVKSHTNFWVDAQVIRYPKRDGHVLLNYIFYAAYVVHKIV